MKPKILLTGGSGFIGRNLIEQLGSKYTFLSPTHLELELTHTTAVRQFLRHHPVDLVIHAANIGGTTKTNHLKDIVEINLKIFFNLFSCSKYFKRMIYFGSGAEYDKRRSLHKVKEVDFGQYIPADAYGFYKYVSNYFAQVSTHITNLRLFAVYGKYEDYSQRFISQAIRQVLLNRPITIRQNIFFDYLYIDDLVKIVDYFINHKPQHSDYNIGRGRHLNLVSIAQDILKVSGKKLPIIVKHPGLNREYTCNVSRLLQEMPGLRYTNFTASLKAMLDYYQSLLSSTQLSSSALVSS